MNEPTEFKYPLDEYGDPYFAGTHINAVQGLEDFTEDINSVGDKVNSVSDKVNSVSDKVNSVNDKVDRAERNIKIVDENIHNLEDAFKGLIGVSGWFSYANNLAPGVKANAMYGSTDGMKCEIKEVRIGVVGLTPVVRYKTISYNLRDFKLGEQVAQLPNGFMTKAQTFPAFGNGNMGAYRVEVTKSGAMTIWGGLNNKNLSTNSYWIYGQHTWIE